MARAVVVLALCLALAAVAATALSGDGAPERTAAAAAPPGDAPVRDCRDRITGAFTQVGGRTRAYRFRVRPRHDTVLGPLALSGAADYGLPGQWDALIRDDTWPKTIAMVRRGARVTLEVPAEQRAWMVMEYAHTSSSPHAVTLRGCPRRATEAACGPGSRQTCARGPTPFSGGFTVDYARAPLQGRCAELIVWVQGRPEPLRKRIFRPRGVACPPLGGAGG
jgi:hypothetical protein